MEEISESNDIGKTIQQACGEIGRDAFLSLVERIREFESHNSLPFPVAIEYNAGTKTLNIMDVSKTLSLKALGEKKISGPLNWSGGWTIQLVEVEPGHLRGSVEQYKGPLGGSLIDGVTLPSRAREAQPKGKTTISQCLSHKGRKPDNRI